jgi:hypothetical protein
VIQFILLIASQYTAMKINENEVQQLLGKQFLITSFLETKLQVLNYIKQGYDDNKPILMNNRFLHFTAHMYYRSIIIDLYALFGQPTGNNKNSFFHIKKKYDNKFDEAHLKTLLQWIENERSHITIVQNSRREQIAHYDFSVNESITLNFDHLASLNALYKLSVRIISFCGKKLKGPENEIAYDLGRQHTAVKSLIRLIEKANKG